MGAHDEPVIVAAFAATSLLTLVTPGGAQGVALGVARGSISDATSRVAGVGTFSSSSTAGKFQGRNSVPDRL